MFSMLPCVLIFCFSAGSAGTGKSFLLKQLVTSLRKKHGNGAVFVIASTGIAACAIDGVTVHRYGHAYARNDVWV